MKRISGFRMIAASAAALVMLSGCQNKKQSPSSSNLASASTASGTSAEESNSIGTTAGSQTGESKTSGGAISRKTNQTTSSTKTIKEYALKQADYIPSPNVWRTPYLNNSGFYFEVEMSSLGELNAALIKASINHFKLGEYVSAIPDVRASEWGYSALNIPTGGRDGNNSVMNNTYLDHPAKTRTQALANLKKFLLNQYIKGRGHDWSSMNGHYPWHHYAGEFGFDFIGSEIGENIRNYQLQIAMNRGAARQYGKPWFIDFSDWHGAGITDYCSIPIWPGNSGADNGHSLSLFERSIVMSYMGGAGSVVAEAGSAISFSDKITDGYYTLSPYGEVCRRFNAFVQANPDVGIAYTPCAVVLDYYHGSYMGGNNKKAFGFFDYTAGDNMTWSLMDMIWPGAWTEHLKGNETGTLVNNSYGDYFDALLQNAPQDVLNSYPVLVLTGDIQLSGAEKSRYKKYAEQGGVLVLNSAYIKQFPEYSGTMNSNSRYEKKAGKGRVIVYGSDYQVDKLPPILKELLSDLVPVTVSTDIQRIVSIKDGSMYVTLINNDGVTKTAHAKPVVDKSKAKSVTVTYKGDLAIKSVKDIYNGKSINLSGKKVTANVQPGGIVILKFQFD